MQMMKKTSDVEFNLHTRPISAGRPQVYKNGGIGDTPRYYQFKKEVQEIMERDIGKRTVERYVSELEVSTGYVATISCYYKVKNHEFWGVPMIKRPDLDNVAKAILDQVVARLGIDDGTVFRLDINKEYAKEDGIKIHLEGYQIPVYKQLKTSNGKGKKRSKEVREHKQKRLNELLEKYKDL